MAPSSPLPAPNSIGCGSQRKSRTSPTQRRRSTARFRAYGLDGKLALAAELNGNSELVLPRFRLAAADSTIDGSLRVALDTGLMRGSVTGRSADLAPWSKLAGTPLGGSVEFGVGLDAPGGQLVDISANGTKLAAGTGSSRIAAGRLAVTARFADILRAPSGSARLSLSTASFGASELATATLSLDAPRPGRFVFQGDAKGQPLTVALAGDGALEPGRADLRLNRLAGSLGGERLVARAAAHSVKTWRRSRLFRSRIGLWRGSDHRQRRGAGELGVARLECGQFADRFGRSASPATARSAAR